MTLSKNPKRTEVSPATSESSLARRIEQPGFLRDYDTIFNEFRRSFDNLMRPFFPVEISRTISGLRPIRYAPTDLVDEGDSYSIQIELPGLAGDDIDLQINNSGLTLRAEKEQDSEEREKNYLHRERYYASFARDISFPEEVDPDKVEASMDKGVLQLKIQKKEPLPEERPRKIEIK